MRRRASHFFAEAFLFVPAHFIASKPVAVSARELLDRECGSRSPIEPIRYPP